MELKFFFNENIIPNHFWIDFYSLHPSCFDTFCRKVLKSEVPAKELYSRQNDFRRFVGLVLQEPSQIDPAQFKKVQDSFSRVSLRFASDELKISGDVKDLALVQLFLDIFRDKKRVSICPLCLRAFLVNKKHRKYCCKEHRILWYKLRDDASQLQQKRIEIYKSRETCNFFSLKE